MIIVTENRELGPDCEVIHLYVIRKRFNQTDAEALDSKPNKYPVTVITSSTVVEIGEKEVVIQDNDFNRSTLEVDDIVTCHTKPNLGLYNQLKEAGLNDFNVGDSVAPRTLNQAVKEGANFALTLEDQLVINPNHAIVNNLPIDLAEQLNGRVTEEDESLVLDVIQD